MNSAPLSPDIEAAIRRALRESWSDRTQPVFDAANPSYNQCAQTAIVVFEKFKGEILKTVVPTTDGHEIVHFYNRIGGRRYDFTAEQFDQLSYVESFNYQDDASGVAEAQATLQGTQLNAIRHAFGASLKRHMPPNTSFERTLEE